MHVNPRILAVRVGRAGDLVMITPALNLLLSSYPNAELHLLTSPEGRRVLNGYHPRLTRFLIFRTGFLREILGKAGIMREIREAGYSRVFVFEADPRFHRLFEEVGAAVHLLPSGPPTRHYSLRCVSLVDESLPVPGCAGWVTLPVTEDGRRKAEAYFQSHGVEKEDCLAGFHATFSQASALPFRKREARLHRSWPADSFAHLACLLHERARSENIPLRIIIDVLPGERRLVEAIERQSGGTIRVISGPPDFERYKAVLERMALLVTPDTGPMHIAAAVGTPLVALFSNKSPEDCGPFVSTDKYKVLRAADTAQPRLGLAAITPESVCEACSGFLAAWRSSHLSTHPD